MDTDVDVGISFPGSFTSMDYDNHGPNQTDQVNDFLHAELGVQVQVGELGVAATADLLRYSVVNTGGLDVTAGRYHVLAAYGIADNQVVIGAGVRAVTMQLSQGTSLTNALNPLAASLTMTGLGPELGTVIKPNNLPFRLGATFRSTVSGTPFGGHETSTSATGVVTSGGVIIPSSVTLPWELETGFAVQVGPRPLNPPWIDPHDQDAPLRRAILSARERRALATLYALAETVAEYRATREAELAAQEAAIRLIEEQQIKSEEARLKAERKARYANWPREKILVVASVLVTGASSNSIALEDFFEQKLDNYGKSVTASARLGIEAEPIPDWLKARIGSYVEPSRFEGVTARQHFTSGFDIKLHKWEAFGLFPGQIWRLSGVADVAPRYTDWGISFGAWH